MANVACRLGWKLWLIAASLALMAGHAVAGESEKPLPSQRPPVLYLLSDFTANATVSEKIAKFAAEVTVRTLTDGRKAVTILPPDVSLSSYSVKDGETSGLYLLRHAEGYQLLLSRAGTYTLSLEYVTKVNKQAANQRSITVPYAPAVRSVVSVTLPGRSLEVSVDPLVSYDTEAAADTTLVTIYGTSDKPVNLSWVEKPEERELPPLLFAEQEAILRVSRDSLRIDSDIHFSIIQGQVKQLEVTVPEDCTLLNLEGDQIVSWDAEGEGEDRVIRIDLLTNLKGSCDVKLSAEKVLADASFTVPGIAARGVERERGHIGIIAAKGLKVESENVVGISQVDVKETPVSFQKAANEINLAYRYLKRPFDITAKVGDVEPKVAADILTAVKVSPESLRLSSHIRFDIKDAGVFRLRLSLGEGLELRDMEGANINTQSVEANVVTVDLRSKAEGEYELDLDAEYAMTAPADDEVGQSISIPTIEVLDVTRQRGSVALSAVPGIKIEPEASEGASQVNIDDLPKELQTDGHFDLRLRRSRVDLAYRYIAFPYKIDIVATKIKPEVSAEFRSFASIEEKELNVTTEVDYDIKKEGIFALRLHFPQDLQILNVEGENIDNWKIERESQVLIVGLTTKTEGSYHLTLTSEQRIPDLYSGLDVPSISGIDLKKETGYVAIRTEASVKLRSDDARRENLTDIDVKDLPPSLKSKAADMALAFKYFQAPWKLHLDVEKIDPHVSCETFNFLGIGDAIIEVSATLKYTILYAGVSEFKLKLPEGVGNVDINGDDIKHKGEDEESGIWTVTLQSKKTGEYRLYVRFQKEMKDASGELSYTGCRAEGAQRETGYIAVATRSDVEIQYSEKTEGLTPIDESEIPEEYKEGIAIPILLSFKYFKPDYSLAVDVTKHDAVEVQVAYVEACRLDTTLIEEGFEITDAAFRLRNTRLDYLRLILPPSANAEEGAEDTYTTKVWHAFVENERVLPLKDKEGRTLIPIAGRGKGSQGLVVHIRYERKGKALGGQGALALRCPEVEMPIMRLGWRICLPEDYRLIRHAGNLEPVTALESQLSQLQPGMSSAAAGSGKSPRQRAIETEGQPNAQCLSNRLAQDNIRRFAGQGGFTPGTATVGNRPETANVHMFQTLIAIKQVGEVRSQYVKREWDTVAQGLLAVVLAVAFLAFWRKTALSLLVKIVCFLVVAGVFLAIRTVAPDAYTHYVNWAIRLSLAGAALVVAGAILGWGRDKTIAAKEWHQGRRDRKHGPRATAAPPPVTPAPAAEEPEATDAAWQDESGVPPEGPGAQADADSPPSQTDDESK